MGVFWGAFTGREFEENQKNISINEMLGRTTASLKEIPMENAVEAIKLIGVGCWESGAGKLNYWEASKDFITKDIEELSNGALNIPITSGRVYNYQMIGVRYYSLIHVIFCRC